MAQLLEATQINTNKRKMDQQRDVVMTVRNVTFAEADELDFEYYAFNNCKKSAATVERMRKGIWHKEYQEKPDRLTGMITRLNDDRDDIE